MKGRPHTCHNDLCEAECPPEHLLCVKCWSLVPPVLKKEVNDTVGKRIGVRPNKSWAAWWRAQSKAIDACVKAGMVQGLWTLDEDQISAWAEKLEEDLKFADKLEKENNA